MGDNNLVFVLGIEGIEVTAKIDNNKHNCIVGQNIKHTVSLEKKHVEGCQLCAKDCKELQETSQKGKLVANELPRMV